MMHWILMILVILFAIRAYSFAGIDANVSATYASGALVALTLLFTRKEKRR